VFAGFSMVSNFRFYSGKDINLRKVVSFRVIVGTAIGVGLLSFVADTLAELLLAVSVLYALSGYAMALADRLRRPPARAAAPVIGGGAGEPAASDPVAAADPSDESRR
jgi:CDP-diacylglycerol--serine O-phosphatidyltransferase